MDTFRVILYAVAILTSFLCATLLFRGYVLRRFRLLLWSAVCFARLTINNHLLFVDLIMFPDIDLRLPRLIAALVGIAVML